MLQQVIGPITVFARNSDVDADAEFMPSADDIKPEGTEDGWLPDVYWSGIADPATLLEEFSIHNRMFQTGFDDVWIADISMELELWWRGITKIASRTELNRPYLEGPIAA